MDICHGLIIEDEPLIALEIEDCLAHVGATSFAFATTAAEAVQLAREQRPGVITSDVKLRDGTGPEAIAVIRRELGSIPVLFITATPNPCQETDPPKDIFSKPMDTHAVSEAFRGYLKAALERRVASAHRD